MEEGGKLGTPRLRSSTLVDLDLSPWAGPVRVAFEFDNVCGDAFGVEWGIDDVLICEQNVLPT